MAARTRLPKTSIDPIRTFRGISHEVSGGYRLAADWNSFARYGVDVLLFRLFRLFDPPGKNRPRRIRLGGEEITYRLNRGDIQSIREVWIDEVYTLPFSLKPDTVVDLGANIGLTSLWMVRKYGSSRIIAVEPSSSNARIARINLSGRGFQSEVIEAAVGPQDGSALYQASEDCNQGKVSTKGTPVRMVSMDSVLEKLPENASVDLLKMDIEGGEEALLSGNLGWLSRVRSIIAEFHPPQVDYEGLVRKIEGQGFRYLPANSVHPGSMDAFLRVE